MEDSTGWREETYRKTYEEEIRGLRRRLEADPSCTAEDLEGTLKNLYIMDGSDWLGRGEVQSLTLAAVIAAYEAVITGLRNKPDGFSPKV
ncbi:MAG: hypothetical protein LBD09_00550 [Treponema sp.]|jgi:hypothetical protein|nr:hypothetical protein [Treponema sp.]